MNSIGVSAFSGGTRASRLCDREKERIVRVKDK